MDRSIMELSQYRFGCSCEALEDARTMYRLERYDNAVDRAYYSMFHGMRAVNTLDGFDSSKHSRVFAHFNQTYIKQGHISKEAAKLLRAASEKREGQGAPDAPAISQEEAAEQIRRAETFMTLIEEYLQAQEDL